MSKAHGWSDHTPGAKHYTEAWAASARGWLWDGGAVSLGNYLDYGPDHYRSPHEYCKPGKCTCRDSQPGNIHCVVYRGTDGLPHSRYVETIEEAKTWIEAVSGYATAELYSEAT